MSSIFIFLGPEIGKKQDEIKKIREKLSKKDAPEESVYYAGETPAAEIAEAVMNQSLFAGSRFIIIKSAEQIKKKEDISMILSSMEILDSHTTLLLVSDENKIASGFEGCCPQENKKIFYEMFEREKEKWIRDFFLREGAEIETSAITAILEMVENNTDSMRKECSRLLLFLPKDRRISEEDVVKWLSHNREESAFTLFSRIAAGDIEKAAEILNSLLSSKESHQNILGGLAWCFRKLRDYLNLLEKSEPNSFELKKIGLSSPKAKDDYTAASKRYNARDADACLALTAEYDILLRSSGAALTEILMYKYLLKIMRKIR